MSKLGVQLQNNAGKAIYPRTLYELVANAQGVTLADILAAMVANVQSSVKQNYVSYKEPASGGGLSSAEKEQARSNIGAVGLKSIDGELYLWLDGAKVKPNLEMQAGDVTYDGQSVAVVLGSLLARVLEAEGKLDVFLDENAIDDGFVNTLKEIQNYITADKTGAAALLGRVDSIEKRGVSVKEDNTGLGTVLGAKNSLGELAKIWPQTLAANVLMSAFGDETIKDALDDKQDVLSDNPQNGNIKTLGGVSVLGTGDVPLKTVNGQNIVGEGDIKITPDAMTVFYYKTDEFE